MPIFEYKGINSKGAKKSGMIDADNVATAKRLLRKDGIFPSSLRMTSESRSGKNQRKSNSFDLFNRISSQQITNATRILATLVKAHIPLVEALTALVEQIENIKLKRIFSTIRDNVNEGSALGVALGSHPKVFSHLYINMVKAGEASGALDIVLEKLADLTEKQLQLKNKITSSMAYPVMMAVIGSIVLAILFTVVIPKITSIFADVQSSLPLPTVILLGVTDIFTNYWYVLVLMIVGAVYWFKKYTSRLHGLKKYHQLLLRLPIVGNLVRFVAISRFCGTMSTLLSSGVPLMSSLNIVKNIVGNEVLKEVIEKAAINVSEGAAMSRPLKESGVFPPIVTHMIEVGERTGDMEEMLTMVSDSYENQVEATITTMTSLIEPIMISVMGVIVGFIVMAILLPIFDMQQLVK